MDFLLSSSFSVGDIGIFGYLFAFLISFAESLPFIGLALPGTVFILFFGFLSSQGYLHFHILFWCVVFGAMLGDFIGYRLGKKGVRFFREENRILWASHLRRGERFFRKHGERSIFLGRFVGVLRPIIPFVVGLSGMRPSQFLLWDLFAALLWGWSHLMLGYFFGGAASVIETWFTRASAFLIAVILLFVGLWYVAKRSQPFFRTARSVLGSVRTAILANPDLRRFLDRYPRTIAFFGRRLDRKRFTGLPLSLLSVAFVYLLLLLSGVTEGVVTAEPIVSVDLRVANLMYAFRDPGFIRVFLWITLLGRRDIVVMVSVSAVAAMWIFRRRAFILPFLVSVLGSQSFSTIGKRLVHRPRPSIAYYLEPSFSFPSGHATIAVALYGFLAYVLLRSRKRRWRYRTLVLFLTLALVSAIGLSRIYLGEHYLGDVWGGYLLGGLWLIIGISIAEKEGRIRPGTDRHAFRSPLSARAAVLALVLVPVLWYVFQGFRYDPLREPIERNGVSTVSEDILGSFSELSLPRYSETFSGAHQEPISFLVVARDDPSFSASMDRAGWLLSDPVTVSNMVRLAEASMLRGSYPRAPMTPSFWNLRVHDFGFQKETADGTVRKRHHARFWKTSLRTPDGSVVYAGTASLDVGIKWVVTHRIAPDIDTEREVLFGDLESAGVVGISEKIRSVDPVLGQNFSGDPFFTDGEAYLIRLR